MIEAREKIEAQKSPRMQELDDESALIEQAISSHGFTELLEDKTVDMIAAIVANKLKPIIGAKSEQSRGQPPQTGAGDVLKMGVTILSAIIMGFMAYTLMTDETDKDKPIDLSDLATAFPDKKRSLMIRSFEFQRASVLNVNDHTGREEVIESHKNMILQFNAQIANLSLNELNAMNAYTRQNFLLEGPPGTGKTIFVMYIVSLIDKELKKNYLFDPKANKETIALKKKYDAGSEDEKADILKAMRSRVIYCKVSPSSINNKYVGGSEKNVSVLFDSAQALAVEKHTSVFLFFDEGDVLFEERSGSGSDGNSAAYVKSELLQRIGGLPPTKYYPVFVYCATNRPKVFDDAFKRRFGKQDYFGYPTPAERKVLLKKIFSKFEEISEEVMDIMVGLTVGKSQSFISNQTKEFYLICPINRYEEKGFNLQGYVSALVNNRNNTNLG